MFGGVKKPTRCLYSSAHCQIMPLTLLHQDSSCVQRMYQRSGPNELNHSGQVEAGCEH